MGGLVSVHREGRLLLLVRGFVGAIEFIVGFDY